MTECDMSKLSVPITNKVKRIPEKVGSVKSSFIPEKKKKRMAFLRHMQKFQLLPQLSRLKC